MKPTGLGTAWYLQPELLKTIKVPGGGEIRVEACRSLVGGPPIVRNVAEFTAHEKAETIESYVQVPHTGFDQLHGPEAEQAIENDIRRLLRLIDQRRRG